jgi:hypothetical protein
MRKLTILILFLIACAPTISFGTHERLAATSIYAQLPIGSIIVHTNKWLPAATKPIYGIELGIAKQTFGQKEWNAKYKYPTVSLSALYFNYGNRQVLGQSIAGLVGINFKLINTRNFELQAGIKNGMAILTRKYNFFSNPTNNVIGSKINEVTQFNICSFYKLGQKGHLLLSGAFTHYSNARFTSPNLGINAVSGSLGYKYYLQGPINNFRPTTAQSINKKTLKNIRTGFARNESVLPGGAKNNFHTIYIGLAKRINYVNKLHMGLWAEYSSGYRNTILLGELYNITPEIDATKFAISFADEFMFGRFSIQATMGLYLYQGFEKNKPLFQNLGINYAVLKFGKQRQNEIYIGTQLKTHSLTAEYFETYIGLKF